MFDKVRETIRKKVEIPEADLARSFEFCRVHKYGKGDFILKTGEYCRFIAFLNSGLIVCLVNNDGKEVASSFIHEGCFFTYTEGLSVNVPSHKDFVALENCEVLMISKEQLPMIYSINPKFETLFTHLLAEEVRNLMLNAQQARNQSLEERYLRFLDTFPNAFNRIPLKHIAGYLGIEPQSLSRLRRRMATK